MTCRVVEYLNENKMSLFILGGKPGVAETAAENQMVVNENDENAGFTVKM